MMSTTTQPWYIPTLFKAGTTFTLAAPIIVGLKYHDTSTAWIAALCGAFVTIVSRFDDLTKVSLGPLKAEMREAINEANATIEQLREVATTITDATLTDLSAGMFWGGLSTKSRLDYHPKMIASLQKIGASQEQIDRAEAGWRNAIGILYLNHITKAAEAAAPNASAFTPARGELRNAFKDSVAPAPSALEQVLSSHSLTSPEIKQWLDDYHHFLATKEIRRYDEFAKD
ncbi:conserved hypothetical protein [uncultured Alphaproteobacteria bacterium]|uniref:Uncharacterized protein n=1 Tax=uncultured Alphaproteobacteria bacterium TaxID=91750 RepID=A0A212KHW8_9PROT|nr:conserved hypothetical protein [uncultured Alphaproteobacteria bacterium]